MFCTTMVWFLLCDVLYNHDLVCAVCCFIQPWFGLCCVMFRTAMVWFLLCDVSYSHGLVSAV